jgi:flagellar protein FliS
MHAAARMYKSVDLESAPKTRILEKLFERFARDVETARTAIAARDIHGKAQAIDHALRIVGELAASLDHTAAPELCQNLAALYAYVANELSRANISLKREPLDRAAKVMAELDAAFREAHSK